MLFLDFTLLTALRAAMNSLSLRNSSPRINRQKDPQGTADTVPMNRS